MDYFSRNQEIVIKTTDNPKYNIIFLHGFISSKEIFIDLLNKKYYPNCNLYAFDYQGKKNKNKVKFKFLELAQELISFINKYNLDNVILVAHSMGGGVVAIAYESIKEKIKKILLISPLSPAVIFSSSGIPFLKGTIKSDVEAIKNILFDKSNIKKVYPVELYIERDYDNYLFNKKRYINLGVQLIKPSILIKVMNCYKKINCPTLLITGSGDRIIPSNISISFFKKLKNENFSYEIIDKTGHVSWIEDIKTFMNFYLNFINKK